MAYWGSIEYWGESNGWPKKGWNYSFFSHTLEPYPTAWLVKSAFCEDEPVVRLGVLDAKGSESISWNDIQVGQTSLLSHWKFTAGSKQRVFVFTNAPQAELFMNGKSLGTKPNNGTGNMQHFITWDVDYQPGTLLVLALDANGNELARRAASFPTTMVSLLSASMALPHYSPSTMATTIPMNFLLASIPRRCVADVCRSSCAVSAKQARW